MNTTFKIFIAAVFTVSIMLLPSCSKNGENACKSISCNNGNCTDGICICNQYFEGNNCDVQYRDKFIGVWAGTAVCGSNNSSYSITITAGNDVALVSIFNIKNAGLTFNGSATSPNGIVMPEQIINGSRVTATVSLEAGILTVSTFENSGEYCTFKGIKQ